MKIRDVIKRLEDDGWRLVATRVTVAGKPGDDVATGTLKSIWRQAQLPEERS